LEWATEPNPRKSKFSERKYFPIEESGQLQFLPFQQLEIMVLLLI
jgi:hypothetical protein